MSRCFYLDYKHAAIVSIYFNVTFIRLRSLKEVVTVPPFGAKH